MNIVGLGHLTTCAAQHPRCAGTIWAVHALLASAAWRSSEEALAQLGSLVEVLPDGRMTITTRTVPQLRFRVQVKFPLGLVRVEAVEVLHEGGGP